jgi:hypothetical protein
MFFTISFSKSYYEENEKDIKKYFKENYGDMFNIIQFPELKDEILIQVSLTSVEFFMQILNHYLFDTSINAIASLIITIPNEYYVEMTQWGYLEKEIKTDYKVIKEEKSNLIYIVLDLAQFNAFEKVMTLVEYYYNSWYDDDDNFSSSAINEEECSESDEDIDDN